MTNLAINELAHLASTTERNTNAALRLAEKGITRLAVLGPVDSPDSVIAHQLGIEEIEYHSSPEGVLKAAAKVGNAGIARLRRSDEVIDADHRPSLEARLNSEAINKAGLAALATVELAVDDTSYLARVVTNLPRPKPQSKLNPSSSPRRALVADKRIIVPMKNKKKKVGHGFVSSPGIA
jgi:hypothetical protein